MWLLYIFFGEISIQVFCSFKMISKQGWYDLICISERGLQCRKNHAWLREWEAGVHPGMTWWGQNCTGGEDSEERMHLGCTRSIKLTGVGNGMNGKREESGHVLRGARLKGAVLRPLSAQGFTAFYEAPSRSLSSLPLLNSLRFFSFFLTDPPIHFPPSFSLPGHESSPHSSAASRLIYLYHHSISL